MHFEFLIEDKSGAKMLEILVPKMINREINTYNIHAYGGIGSIPKDGTKTSDVKKQALLNDLPKILTGFGKSFKNFDYCVIVICDLDNRDLTTFKDNLQDLLNSCKNKPPHTAFCFAIEEGEAWLLGDMNAIETAYPNVKKPILKSYVQDSICGTWELLNKAINQSDYPKKSEWAEKITPHMLIDNNKSPSFQYFVKKVNNFKKI